MTFTIDVSSFALGALVGILVSFVYTLASFGVDAWVGNTHRCPSCDHPHKVQKT